MNATPSVTSNVLWNAVNTAGTLVFGLVTSIVLARFLGPAELGRYHYWIWVARLLVLFSSPGLTQAMTRFGAEYLGKGDRQTASALFMRLLVAELTIGTLVAAVTLVYALTAPLQEVTALVLVALSVLPALVERHTHAAITGTQDFRFLSQIGLAANLFYSVSAIAAVSFGFGLHGLLLVLLARRVVQLLLVVWKLPVYFPLRGALSFAMPPGLLRRLFFYCRDVTLILITDTILYDRSELFFLRLFSTSSDIAYYSQSFELAIKAMAIPAILSGVLIPSFSSLVGQQDRKRFEDLHYSSYRILALIAMPIGLGGAAIAPAFVKLYGPDFLAMAPVLTILLVGNIVGALAAISSTVLHSVERQYIIVRLGLTVTVINIGLDFLLIPSYGAVGAAIANSGSQLISGVVGIAYTVHYLDLPFPFRALGRIGLAALASAAAAWLVSLWLGGLVLAIFAGVVAYPVALRLFAALDESDQTLFDRLTPYLPRTVTPLYQSLIDFVLAK